jgi:hypothetical protein
MLLRNVQLHAGKVMLFHTEARLHGVSSSGYTV